MGKKLVTSKKFVGEKPKRTNNKSGDSYKPVVFNPLPKDVTPEQIEMAYHQALIRDAEDVAERTRGVSFVKRGTAAFAEEYNYAGLQSLGTNTDLRVTVRPLTEKERTRDPRNADATHVIETNIKSGVRWKRQLKILKDLMQDNNMTVIQNWTGTAVVRIGDANYIKKPTVNTRLDTDANKYSWVGNTTESDLKKLNTNILEKRQDGTKWFYRISVEDAQKIAVDGFGNPFKSVDSLVHSQKVDANINAEYGTEPLPYPEAIRDEYREETIATHEKKRKERIADRKREELERQEYEKKQAEKRAKTDKRTQSTKCPKCGGSMVERSGKYGKFYGCSNYPNCSGTRRRR